MAGFPPGTSLNRALEGVYYRLEPVQFLRTTYKATPLISIGVACLAGAAAGEAWRRLGAARTRLARPLAARSTRVRSFASAQTMS